MTIQLKTKYTTIFFSALVAFALLIGQPLSSNASDQLELHDEMINHVYTPHWMVEALPKTQEEVKTESSQYASEQLELRDEMINHVYTPHWMEPKDQSQGEVKTESSRYASEQLELRDEMINHVYTPLF